MIENRQHLTIGIINRKDNHNPFRILILISLDLFTNVIIVMIELFGFLIIIGCLWKYYVKASYFALCL